MYTLVYKGKKLTVAKHNTQKLVRFSVKHNLLPPTPPYVPPVVYEGPYILASKRPNQVVLLARSGRPLGYEVTPQILTDTLSQNNT